MPRAFLIAPSREWKSVAHGMSQPHLSRRDVFQLPAHGLDHLHRRSWSIGGRAGLAFSSGCTTSPTNAVIRPVPCLMGTLRFPPQAFLIRACRRRRSLFGNRDRGNQPGECRLRPDSDLAEASAGMCFHRIAGNPESPSNLTRSGDVVCAFRPAL